MAESITGPTENNSVAFGSAPIVNAARTISAIALASDTKLETISLLKSLPFAQYAHNPGDHHRRSNGKDAEDHQVPLERNFRHGLPDYGPDDLRDDVEEQYQYNCGCYDELHKTPCASLREGMGILKI